MNRIFQTYWKQQKKKLFQKSVRHATKIVDRNNCRQNRKWDRIPFRKSLVKIFFKDSWDSHEWWDFFEDSLFCIVDDILYQSAIVHALFFKLPTRAVQQIMLITFNLKTLESRRLKVTHKFLRDQISDKLNLILIKFSRARYDQNSSFNIACHSAIYRIWEKPERKKRVMEHFRSQHWIEKHLYENTKNVIENSIGICCINAKIKLFW